MIVVVGSGIAGLTTALTLHDAAGRRAGGIAIVTKSRAQDGNTRYAQGGIAAALFAGDSTGSHVADTLTAGAGLADPDAVRHLCERGPRLVRDLIRRGVAFDTVRTADAGRTPDDGGPGDGGPRESLPREPAGLEALARGREGAHSRPRIVHAGGDATGAVIEAALLDQVRRAGISVHEHTFLADLLTDEGPSGARRVCGVRVIGPDGVRRDVAADAVVLACGGAGQLYSHTTNPTGATGDGVAAAWRAGAVIADAEFYQFHPTALHAGRRTLVSEAVRGEGAVLVDSAGRRFMPAVHPDAELAPRDVVARAIAEVMAEQDGRPALLDARPAAQRLGGGAALAARFPGITAACRDRGFDWTCEPIPVTPAAHYWMGGVRTDLSGRTSLPGLYAVGEVARTGVHGANRLASNSLLEGLVFADAAARDIAGWATAGAGERGGHPGVPVPDFGGVRTLGEFPSAGRTATPRADLQRLLWDRAGLFREEGDLEVAGKQLAAWRPANAADRRPGSGDTASIADRNPGSGDTAGIADLETENLRQVGMIVAAAASARRESLGAHYRHDHPEPPAHPQSVNFVTRETPCQ